MARIAIIGAGSQVFAQAMLRDSMTFPALAGSTFVLMDIDEERLSLMEKIARRLVQQGGYAAKIEATTDRREALKGADFVIVAILVGGREPIAVEIDIPLKYGVDQAIGDTMGPGGIFRFCRTIPTLLEIARDMKELCPQAVMLNYTNPMNMLCRALTRRSNLQIVGLCHSVQEVVAELAQLLEVKDRSKVAHLVAGINHQAWVLRYDVGGVDRLPDIRRLAWENKSWWQRQTVKVEQTRYLGHYSTEASGHNSEYSWWFRKRPELKKKYTPGGGWNGGSGFIKELYRTEREIFVGGMRKVAEQTKPYDLRRGAEYGSYIMNALVTGEPFVFNGNVPNTGLITNLPPGASVEVPVVASKSGLQPCYVGALPPQLAALNNAVVNSQEMGVEAALSGNREMLFWAIAYDPLTAAVLSLEEIKAMVDEMFEAEKQWLPQFS